MLSATGAARTVTGRLDSLLGGPARRRVVVVLACVLALDSADKSTVGTAAIQLQSALGIGRAQIGLLLAVSSIVGAAATVPAGMAVDRFRRTRLLTIAVACWGIAMVLSGLAPSFTFLLVTRVALGIVASVAGPGIASLVGDYFPQSDRGRIYGFVLSGELIGAGFGFVVAGQFAVLSWRAPFFVLALPTVAVVWLAARLPEPARGGASRIPKGAGTIRGVDAHADSPDCDPHPEVGSEQVDGRAGGPEESAVRHAAREARVKPRPTAVLTDPPDRMSLWQAVHYVLRVRTNVVLIAASALGYFFFSGVRGFAIEFAKQQYGVPQSVATGCTLVLGAGALLGVLLGGRLADRLMRHGRLAARVEVAGVAVLAAAALFVPALTATSVAVAIPLLFLAAGCLGMVNPPLDAARLDIVHPLLWGRAEAVRSLLRNLADAAAPLLFGVLSQFVFTGADGLERTFLLMLAALIAAALLALTVGRRTYPHDVAAVAESLERTHRVDAAGA